MYDPSQYLIDEHHDFITQLSITHRIHGAGIYANIGGIWMVNVTIYIPYMDPMGNETTLSLGKHMTF